MRTHLRGNAPRNGQQTVEIPSGFGGEESEWRRHQDARDQRRGGSSPLDRRLLGQGFAIRQVFFVDGAVRPRPVDSSPSLHDQEHGERDDGAYQDAREKMTREEQSP